MDSGVKRWAGVAGWSAGVALLLALGGWMPAARAQQTPGDGLSVVELRPNFFLIGGAGGNIPAQVGPMGVVVVDSGTTEAADRVVAAIRGLTSLPIRYVINTGMDAAMWAATRSWPGPAGASCRARWRPEPVSATRC